MAQGSVGRSETKAPLKNRVFEENREITDEKLRADGGSLSRYSLKINLNYAGPPVSDLSDRNQPNPDNAVGNFQTALGGTMGGLFRLSSRSSLSLSTGLSVIRPFQGTDRFDVNNPIFGYIFADKFAGIQLRTMPAVIIRTVPEFLKVGQFAYLLLGQSAIYDLPGSRFSLGADLSLAYFLYDRAFETRDGNAPLISLELSPLAKYRITSQFSFTTSLAVPLVQHRFSPLFDWKSRSLKQKVGVSYALTRDVYLNPFLAFFPERPDIRSTSLNFASVISIF